jgi:hypothetical protein
MKRLIEKGLMFGNLVHVSGQALVARYNRALRHLTGRETALDEFHIDISGYSPEVGDAFGDHLYLNPQGVNRQFILLFVEQKAAPLLGASFSTTRGIIRQFIEKNESEIFALTTRDAVAGELLDSVFDVSDPALLFHLRRITVEADTTDMRVANARKLADRIERFRSEPGAWHDDLLVAEMIGLAKATGDVVTNPIALAPLTAEIGNFWTSHHGGLYVLRDLEMPAVIASGDAAALGPLSVPDVFGLGDRNAIAQHLGLHELVEPIVKARNVDAAAILRQKMDFVLVDAAAALGEDLSGATRRDLRAVARRLGSRLPEVYQGLAALLRWVEGGGDWPRITSEHPAYFYTLRARQGPDRDLVNQLLAELAPLDVRQLFICHKELFYRLYRTWPDAKQTYVADFLEQEYNIDKAGARRALFGPEPGMEEPAPPEAEAEAPARPTEDMIELVGPWGPVRRRTRS